MGMIQYRKWDEGDIKNIIKLTDMYISDGFYTDEYLRNILSDTDHIIYVCLSEDGIFGGYYYGMIAGLDDAARILHLDTSALKVIRYQIHRNKTTLVGIVKTTVLAPDFRGHTSSNMLMDILMNWFHDKNVRSILCEALIKPDKKINLKTQMETFGFIPSVQINKPWQSIQSYCPYCHQMYCKCDAVIYLKEL